MSTDEMPDDDRGLPVDDGTRITVLTDGAEHPVTAHAAIATELADRLCISPGDVTVDSVRPSMGGAWVTVRVFAPITRRRPAPAPTGECAACGRGFSPTHDADAPGPTVRHPFTPRATR